MSYAAKAGMVAAIAVDQAIQGAVTLVHGAQSAVSGTKTSASTFAGSFRAELAKRRAQRGVQLIEYRPSRAQE